MSKKRSIMFRIGFVFLLFLIILSIYGAFIGAQSASAFFNSWPVVFFWFILVFFFAAGFIYFKTLWKKPSLLFIHLGSVAVLAGGLYSSKKTVNLIDSYLHQQTVSNGYVLLYGGTSSNLLFDKQGNTLGTLPFTLHLNQFHIEYYDTPVLYIQDIDSPDVIHEISLVPGVLYEIGPALLQAKKYDNMQIQIQEGKVSAVEGDSSTLNTGYELNFMLPDGRSEKQYIFDRVPAHSMKNYRFKVKYNSPVITKDFISDLSIVKQGKVIKNKKIEVNHPLYYSGFHFYQSSWGQDQEGRYSVIEVVSNRGLLIVFFGYFLIAIGIFLHFWILPVYGFVRNRGVRL